jgi:bifunctional enzyme CysN/CysC
MPWYAGPALLEHLESIALEDAQAHSGLRLPVQYVNRPHQNFRGFAGTIAAGDVHVGDPVVVLPSGRRSTVAQVLGPSGAVERARAGQAVTLTLTDEVDISRGDVIAGAGDPPEVADQFAAHLLWMDDAALLPGRPYWLKIGARTVSASISEIKHRVDVNTQEPLAAKRLQLNEVGVCNLALDEAIAFAPYADNRALGGFILIDRQSNATVGAGTLDFAGPATCTGSTWTWTRPRARASRARLRACCGSPACPAPASPPSPIWWKNACTRWATTPSSSMATTCATA